MQKQENKPDLNLIYKKYQENYLSKKNEILKFNEDEYQTQFLNDIFVNILGYTLKTQSPKNFNLEQETKNITDSKKADATILKNNKVVAVIELKKSSVKMDSITEQAFIYLNNHENCKYAITSNFNYLRLFIEKSNEFIEFDLFNMNFDKFTEFYNLLSLNSIFDDFPFKEKQRKKYQNMVELEKQFYAEYSQVRKDIFKNIISFEQNLKTPKDIILEKSQKLLDRLIFIFFAESRGLIPFSAKKIIEQWQINNWEEKNLYHIIRLVFKKINFGSKIPKVFNYNGGLFADDDFLDNLHISDEVLQKALHLGFYNFNSEIDVNILGHIFENSLDDLIKIKENLFGDEFDIDKSIRKKDGIFYTPKYIVDYIIENSLGKLCRENREKLSDSEYLEFLKNLKILDPAVGSGAFLNGAFDFLSNEYKIVIEKLNEKATSLFDFHDYDLTILENNLFGVDLNREAVEITKLSLWLKTAKRNRKLTKLNNNIRQGNSLTTFDWSKEFDFKFDVIIGNPPYGAKLDSETKQVLKTKFPIVPDYESSLYFSVLPLDILKNGGFKSFIIPNTFLVNTNAKKYREFLLENYHIESISNLSDLDVFEDAKVRTCITNFRKMENKENGTIRKSFPTKLQNQTVGNGQESIPNLNSQFIDFQKTEFKIRQKIEIKKDLLIDKIDNWLSIFDLKSSELISKIAKFPKLNEFFEVSQGIIAYDKYRGHSEETIKNRIWHSDFKKNDTFKKELKGGDVEKYSLNWNGKNWLSYGDWLGAPRKKEFFTNPRILIREITNPSIFATFTDLEFYNSPSIINVIQRENQNLDLKYLLAILNSNLLGWYHLNNSPKAKKGLFPKILVNDVRNLPIPKISEIEQQSLIQKAEKIMQLKTEFAKVKTEFLDEIRSEYQIKKINKNLDNFENLKSIEEFMLEIQKLTKIKFKTAKEKKDFKNYWNSLFEEESKKLRDLKLEIAKSEKEIDKIVYKLYSLNSDEVQIIEN